VSVVLVGSTTLAPPPWRASSAAPHACTVSVMPAPPKSTTVEVEKFAGRLVT